MPSETDRFVRMAVITILVSAGCADQVGDDAAGETAIGALIITDAVIPAPVTSTDTRASLYMAVRNTGRTADTLVSLSTPLADSITLHTVRLNGAMMRMTPLGPLPLPAGETTVLRPGERHGMLEGLREAIVAGDTIRVTFRFTIAGSREVSVPVVPYEQVSRE